MNCILTHQPLHVSLLSQRYTNASHRDIVDPVLPKKLSLTSSLCVNDACMSKLGGCVPYSNPLAHTNAIFVGQTKTTTRALLKSRHTMSSELRKDFEENPRRKELLLDNTASLHRRMEEYRRQKRTGRYIHIFDTDSDDEDLE